MIFSAIAFTSLILASSNPDPIRVVFIGDSLTAGYGLSPSFSFPTLLETAFSENAEVQMNAINAGVSGDTTAGGLRRLNWQMKSQPELVVIALGANDMLRGIPPEKTKENLAKMIEQLQSKNVKVALLGMLAGSNLGPDYEKTFDAIYPSLSKQFRIPLYPFLLKDVAKIPELNLEDGIHPNKKGQEKIAEHLFQFLKPILTDIQKHKK